MGEGRKGEGRGLSLCIGRERARERIRYDSNAYETGLYFELSPWGVPCRRAGKVKKIVGNIKYVRWDAIDVENKSLAPRDRGMHIRTRYGDTPTKEEFLLPARNKGPSKRKESSKDVLSPIKVRRPRPRTSFLTNVRFRLSTFLREQSNRLA